MTSGADGVAGVLVSDGRHVAPTRSDGTFALPGHGPFAVLTRPTGFRAETWYLPATSEEIVFRLLPAAQDPPFSFIHITDPHLSLGDPAFGEGTGDATFWLDGGTWHERIVTTPAVLDDLLAEIERRYPGAAFVVATGDLTNSGSEVELKAYRSAIAGCRLPVVSIPGNHDLMPRPEDPAGANSGSLYAAVTSRYERHLGPRWFSFEHGGLHFIAIDWFTHLLGLDREDQEAWLAADLSAVAPGTPVVVLSHDQMGAEFYARLPARPVASFSGHWHTSRVARAGATVHYNTGPPTFGGLDYSPAHHRVATWTGARLDVRTVARGPEALSGATFACRPARRDRAPCLWTAELSGGAHMAAPVIHGDLVLATSKDEDGPAGSLEAFDLGTGRRRWVARLGSAVKTSPVLVGDAVVATAVTGETLCADLQCGAERWRSTIADPLRLWGYLRPATDGRRVFVGDVSRFVALDIADGSVVWMREDLGQRENIASHAHPVVVGGRLLVSFAAQVPDLWALDPATGATIWPEGISPRGIYGLQAAEIIVHLPRTPVAGLAADPGGEDLYVVRLGSRIDRVRVADGTVVWSAPFLGWFNPATPLVHGDAVVAVAGTGSVRSLDRATGRQTWITDLPHSGPIAMGAYRADGAALLAGAAADGDRLLVPLGDGAVVALGAEDGRVLARADLGVPIAASPAIGAGTLVVACVDGVLRALPTAALAPVG